MAIEFEKVFELLTDDELLWLRDRYNHLVDLFSDQLSVKLPEDECYDYLGHTLWRMELRKPNYAKLICKSDALFKREHLYYFLQEFLELFRHTDFLELEFIDTVELRGSAVFITAKSVREHTHRAWLKKRANSHFDRLEGVQPDVIVNSRSPK